MVKSKHNSGRVLAHLPFPHRPLIPGTPAEGLTNLAKGTNRVFNFGEELRAAIDAVDPNLHSFFAVAVNSFVRLEIVVLFRRSPGVDMDAAAVAQELGWPEDRVAEELRYLESSGVLERFGNGHGPRFRLSSDPRVSDLVNKFSFLYANRRSRLLILGHILRQNRQA